MASGSFKPAQSRADEAADPSRYQAILWCKPPLYSGSRWWQEHTLLDNRGDGRGRQVAGGACIDPPFSPGELQSPDAAAQSRTEFIPFPKKRRQRNKFRSTKRTLQFSSPFPTTSDKPLSLFGTCPTVPSTGPHPSTSTDVRRFIGLRCCRTCPRRSPAWETMFARDQCGRKGRMPGRAAL